MPPRPVASQRTRAPQRAKPQTAGLLDHDRVVRGQFSRLGRRRPKALVGRRAEGPTQASAEWGVADECGDRPGERVTDAPGL